MDLAIPTAPEDVHAIVVGIEHYPGLGRRWRLPGAVEDAHRMAAWLIGQGVPFDNISLLTSPDPERVAAAMPAGEQGAEDVAVPPVPARPADRATVAAVIRNELPRRVGRLLVFFWAGHGIVDDRDRLCLPFSDTTSNDPSCLILEDTLAWLRSEVFPAGRFERQVIIVDACRLSATDRRLRLADMEYPPHPARRACYQSVLYACRVGEAAQNQADRLSGQLSEVLMAQLADASLDSLNAAVHTTVTAVQNRFAELRAAGEAWQTPVRMHYAGWQDSNIWHETAAGATARRDGLDEKAWRDLERQLAGVTPEPWCEQAFRWSFGTGETAEQAPYAMPDGDLSAWARDLDEYEGRTDGLPQVVAFVHALAAGFRAQEDPAARHRAGALSAWVAKVCNRHSLPKPPEPPVFTSENTTLMVRLDQDPQHEDQVFLDIWLRAAGWQCLEPAEGEGHRKRVTLDKARDILDEHLTGLGGTSTAGASRPFGLRRVEFAVEAFLLEEGFDQWSMSAGLRRPWKLGRRFEVVVRCPEARRNLNLAYLWGCRWDWFVANSGTCAEATVWLSQVDVDDLERLDALIDKWSAGQHPVCVAVDAVSPGHADGWGAALDAGMPVIVWRRPDRADDDRAPASLRELLPIDDVSQLPATVKQLRTDSTVDPRLRSTVVLLWDDPGHALDRELLSDAGLRSPGAP
ncbi:hypothetical protein Caci_3883 [Catenulispora acidiphila DSM 44928]|uniref:Peptidase C14 caspase catalytic subunit p20 n=1 Tax=Catenulispora acidiphila (strain DSM 44928 / JCM 14897 / NBRC 102108 / NRRL B-24433 / ID139908) TaxID=479433 RepID=C7QDH8_CATAD|nr:caspase family protein [Catenulispora acidiphila]ACU72771.1 hypothetical protein Caci_3883 [Catenulispora acidiphila DSM 44928]